MSSVKITEFWPLSQNQSKPFFYSFNCNKKLEQKT